jgi:hypothetical protein
MSKKLQLKLHKITEKSAVLFGSEAWILRHKDNKRFKVKQMKFIRLSAGYTLRDPKLHEIDIDLV